MKKVTANGLSKGEFALLYEFSITPELFDTSIMSADKSAGVILVQILRGIEKNGLLANLNKDKWQLHVKKRVEKLEPALRDRVLTCFSKLYDQHRMVRHPKRVDSDPSTEKGWLNLALDSHERTPFYAIILSQALIDNCNRECNVFIEFFNSLNSERWMGRRETLSLIKSPDNYSSILAPVLRHARSLVLIDPHLDIRKQRFYNTIKICSNMLGQRGHNRLSGRVDIHVAEGENKGKKDYETEEDFFDACKRRLQPLIKQDGHRFRVFIWKRKEDSYSESMHDRYIITDQFGISVSYGLDCNPKSSDRTRWGFLPEEDRDEQLSLHNPSTSSFDFVGSREFSDDSNE